MSSQQFDPRTGKARIFFRYRGRQYNRTVLARSQRAAEAQCQTMDETIDPLERGRLELPAGADLVTFLISGGKVVKSVAAVASATSITLAALFDRYRADPPPHLEGSTRKMQEIHFRRLLEVFPSTKVVASFGRTAAQEYVSRRSKKRHRGRPIQRETIAKQWKTLRQAWSWVATRSSDLALPAFALKELSFPKAKERPPFMSWAQIEREIARGGLGEDETKELWDCVWLDRDEVRGLLEHVRQAGGPAYLHPMVCFAAYTGARRSELCRSQVVDWRFDDKTVKIRQKKRDKEKWVPYRDVPIHPVLAEVLKAWLDGHPGGRLAFCRDKRDLVTWDIATYHLKEVLRESKWNVVRGWHVLRHSASNLARAGVDQRKIDRWMGHSTDVRWRYQHLRPEDQQEDIGAL